MARNKYKIYEFEGTFKCGHTGTISQGGYTEEYARDKAMSIFASSECEECAAITLEREREEEAERLKNESVKEGLPELTGSEKQVRWALSLRDEFATNMRNYIEKLTAYDVSIVLCLDIRWSGMTKEELRASVSDLSEEDAEEKVLSYKEKFYDALDNLLLTVDNSVWFIDHRNTSPRIFISNLAEYLPLAGKEKAEKEIEEEIIREIELEKTIIPEDCNGLIARIFVDDKINIESPKNQALIDVVKANGYMWSDRLWSRPINQIMGSVEERIAEITNKLLANGFGVKLDFPDFKQVREMAIRGDYHVEDSRVVRVDDKHNFVISWIGYNDKLYFAAKKISGAKWNSGMIVPFTSYKEVEDFAYLYDFILSNDAKKLIDAAKEIVLTKGVKVTKGDELKVPDVEEKLNEILNSSRDIIDDLKDDDE